MLMDGGYCNNVPSDVMCTLFHPNTVITVNVEGYPDAAQMEATLTGAAITYR